MTPVVLTLLALVGGALALAYVSIPFWSRGREQADATERLSSSPTPSSARKVAELLEKREAALAGLVELDFDRSLGNLSEADYQDLRSHYRAQAIGVLRALDARGRKGLLSPDVSPATTPDGTRQSAHSSQRPELIATVGAQDQGAARPVNRRALAFIGGAIGVALLTIGGGTLMLRAGSVAPSQAAPQLDVLHTHAALLVPSTGVALVGHHGGLLRSADSGESWQPVAGVEGDVLALAGAPVAETPLFLATSTGVMSSRDAGLTWETLPLPRPDARVTALAVGEGDPAPLYANVAGAGLFRTTDSRNWELVGGGLPETVAALAWRPGSFSALYAAAPGDGILASGDGGQTWGSASGVLNGALPTLAVRSLAVDPNSGDQFTMADGTILAGVMYAGTDLGLFKSVDGGSSWTAMPLREPLSAVAARSSPDPLILAVDSRGRVWRSLDRGASWGGSEER